MRTVLLAILLTTSGCVDTNDGPVDRTPQAELGLGLPEVKTSGGGPEANWTFTASLTNPTGHDIWLAQASCEFGAGVLVSNASGIVGGSHPPGVACGVALPQPLAANATLRFAWVWEGTLHDRAGHRPAPPGTYTFETWVSWREGEGHVYRRHVSHTALHWPG